jgi:uncharacterized protein (DUF3084 family)
LRTQVNWTLIVLIVAGSALFAYLGDVLGSKYGKQRISLFGLRPKYTSRVITALTGIFISVAVLTVMSFFSENVRAALLTMQSLRARLAEHETLLQTTALSLDITRFNLETLRGDRDLLLSEKNDLEASILSLKEEYEETRRALDVMRLGTIVAQANSLLAQTFILPGTPRARVLEIMDALGDDVRVTIAGKRSEKRPVDSNDVRLTFNPLEESAAVARLSDASERMYLRVLAAENIAADEEIRGRLESGPSQLVYEKGAALYRKLIDPREKDFNAEDAMHLFLRELKLRAIQYGILPDPATNSVGSLEGENFFEAVEKLKAIKTATILNAVALDDIYTEGPVRITIVLE